MKNLILIIQTFLASSVSFAETSIVASFKGSATVNTSIVTKYDHNLKCYPMGKGDDHSPYPAQTVSFNSSQVLSGKGTLSWKSSISKPFSRVARSIDLKSDIFLKNGTEVVLITLEDNLARGETQFKVKDCWHQNGQISSIDASLMGSIKVQYKVPDNIWAISVSRSEGKGLLNDYKAITSSLNSEYDKGALDGAVLWVYPGQIIEQEIQIPENVYGAKFLGSLKISFTPISNLVFSEKDFSSFRESLITGKFYKIADSDIAAKFIENSLTILSLNQDLRLYIKSLSILQIKRMTDELFAIANNVYPHSYSKSRDSNFKPDGMSIKTAAALASYQLAKAMLVDMQEYCQDVEVKSAFTGDKQKVLGLRAAGFWLSRSMKMMMSYSYDGFETMLKEVDDLQKQGKTPSDIVADKNLSKMLQRSYQLLTSSGIMDKTPLNVAYVDMNRMIKTFNGIGAVGNTQGTIMAQLKEGSLLESEFIKNFVKALMSFKKNRIEKVDLMPLFSDLKDLKNRQKKVGDLMISSVRLFSIEGNDDQDLIMNQMMSLLNNQINIFSQPVDIPYFDKLRETFMSKEVLNLENSVNGCLGLGGF